MADAEEADLMLDFVDDYGKCDLHLYDNLVREE